MSPTITDLPPEVLEIIVKNTPPDSIVCLGSTCNNLRAFVLDEWKRRLRPKKDCVPLGPEPPVPEPLGPIGPAFCQRYKRLQEVTLLPDEADKLAQDYQMLNLPVIFNDSRLSLAALVKIYAGKGKEGEERLVKALTPRFLRALHLIANPLSSRDYLLGLTVMNKIASSCPSITSAVMETKEGQHAISQALETIALYLNDPDRQDLNTGTHFDGLTRHTVRVGWVYDVRLLVPFLEKKHIIKHLAAIKAAAMILIRNEMNCRGALMFLTATLQRTKSLCRTEEELAPIRSSMFEAIAVPCQEKGQGSLWWRRKAWYLFDAWSQLLGPDDAQLARRAFDLAVDTGMPIFKPAPPSIRAMMQRLAEYLPPDHVKDDLRRTGESIALEASKGPANHPEPRWRTIRNLFDRFEMLCLASDKAAACRACAELASSLPDDFDWSLTSTGAFAVNCGQFLTATLARKVWETRHRTLQAEQPAMKYLQVILESLVPQLDAKDAQTAFEEARDFLSTLGTLHWPGRLGCLSDNIASGSGSGLHWVYDKADMRPYPVKERYQHKSGYVTALLELEALANCASRENRVTEVTEVVKVVLDTLHAIWDLPENRVERPPCVKSDNPRVEANLIWFRAESNLAYQILVARSSCISSDALRRLLYMLREVSLFRFPTDPGLPALRRIVRGAPAFRQMDILEFLETMKVDQRWLEDAQAVWIDFLRRPDCDVEAAHRSYIKVAKSVGRSNLMRQQHFWPLAQIFAERLSPASGGVWIDSVLATLDRFKPAQRKAFVWQISKKSPGMMDWERDGQAPAALASFARVARGFQRERVLRLLLELYSSQQECFWEEKEWRIEVQAQGETVRELLWKSYHQSGSVSTQALRVLYYLADDATLKSWDARLSWTE